jgi:hypothetical protein
MRKIYIQFWDERHVVQYLGFARDYKVLGNCFGSIAAFVTMKELVLIKFLHPKIGLEFAPQSSSTTDEQL